MKKGFTLGEVFCVVTIIGLLLAMVIPAFQKIREHAITKEAQKQGISVMEYKARNDILCEKELKEYRRKKNAGGYSEEVQPFVEAKKEIIIDGKRYKLVE